MALLAMAKIAEYKSGRELRVEGARLWGMRLIDTQTCEMTNMAINELIEGITSDELKVENVVLEQGKPRVLSNCRIPELLREILTSGEVQYDYSPYGYLYEEEEDEDGWTGNEDWMERYMTALSIHRCNGTLCCRVSLIDGTIRVYPYSHIENCDLIEITNRYGETEGFGTLLGVGECAEGFNYTGEGKVAEMYRYIEDVGLTAETGLAFEADSKDRIGVILALGTYTKPIKIPGFADYMTGRIERGGLFNVENVPVYVSGDAKEIKEGYAEGLVADTLKLEEGIEVIGERAFCYTDIDTLEIPSTIRSMDKTALENGWAENIVCNSVEIKDLGGNTIGYGLNAMIYSERAKVVSIAYNGVLLLSVEDSCEASRTLEEIYTMTKDYQERKPYAEKKIKDWWEIHWRKKLLGIV